MFTPYKNWCNLKLQTKKRVKNKTKKIEKSIWKIHNSLLNEKTMFWPKKKYPSNEWSVEISSDFKESVIREAVKLHNCYSYNLFFSLLFFGKNSNKKIVKFKNTNHSEHQEDGKWMRTFDFTPIFFKIIWFVSSSP